MEGADFGWAAALMAERRARAERWSPVLWRPAVGATERHRQFLEAVAGTAGSVALRSPGGFLVGSPQHGRCFVDDFAVTHDELWDSEGRALLLAAWERARTPEQTAVRVVTARRDLAKVGLLQDLGLRVVARWWVRALDPAGSASPLGPVDLGGASGLLVAAPPVYDPGGPVCLLGDPPAGAVVPLLRAGAAHGAVLVIVQRERPEGAVADVAARDPELEQAGFSNASEFHEGSPA
jgi:hypothetical protein